MTEEPATPKSIDEYIAGFPPQIQERLQQIRKAVLDAAPEAEETIKYKMPTFVLNGNLVYFAAYKNHIGFYPRPAGIEDKEFLQALAPYEAAKSSLNFLHDQPIPFDLIRRVVELRIQQNLGKAKKN